MLDQKAAKCMARRAQSLALIGTIGHARSMGVPFTWRFAISRVRSSSLGVCRDTRLMPMPAITACFTDSFLSSVTIHAGVKT